MIIIGIEVVFGNDSRRIEFELDYINVLEIITKSNARLVHSTFAASLKISTISECLDRRQQCWFGNRTRAHRSIDCNNSFQAQLPIRQFPCNQQHYPCAFIVILIAGSFLPLSHDYSRPNVLFLISVPSKHPVNSFTSNLFVRQLLRRSSSHGL